jgi:hypothetical protein
MAKPQPTRSDSRKSAKHVLSKVEGGATEKMNLTLPSWRLGAKNIPKRVTDRY